MPTAARSRERVPTVVVAVTCLAWALSIGAESGGNAPMIGHGHLAQGGLSPVAAIALFLISWQVMLAAMMLPSSIGMLDAFERLARTQPHPGRVQATFVAAYLGVWTAFGLAAFGGDVLLHDLVHSSAWLHRHEWTVGGAVLVMAGAFQFSSVKDRCLTECRTPVGFLVERYRPGPGAAFRLGVSHSMFCIGCCWALMLVAFAAGAGNLVWMGVITTIMVVERTVSWGAAVVRPVGALLVALGVLVMAHPAGFPAVLGPS